MSSVRCPERLLRELLKGWTEVSETVEMVSHCSLSVLVSEAGGFRKSSFAVQEW